MLITFLECKGGGCVNRIQALGVLGLTQSATKEQIKKAYRELCKRLHPDDNPSLEARNQYLIVQEAYRCLNKDYIKTQQNAKPHIYGTVTPNCEKTGKVVGGWQVSREKYSDRQYQQLQLKKMEEKRKKREKEERERKQKIWEAMQKNRKLPSEREAEKWKKIEEKREAERIATLIQKLMRLDNQ